MVPPGWMIEELRRRRERAEQERPQLRIEIPELPRPEPRSEERRETPREPIVIQLW